jgi:predicted nuclease with TOPRIM domain
MDEENEKVDCAVCSVLYQIRLKKGLAIDGCFGVCDNNRETIEAEPEQTDCQLFRTLIHELLHAIIHQTNLNLPDEETAVTQLTRGIFSILADPRNGPAIEWLHQLWKSSKR